MLPEASSINTMSVGRPPSGHSAGDTTYEGVVVVGTVVVAVVGAEVVGAAVVGAAVVGEAVVVVVSSSAGAVEARTVASGVDVVDATVVAGAAVVYSPSCGNSGGGIIGRGGTQRLAPAP